MADAQTVLYGLGLSPNETAVYLGLLKQGSCTASTIATRQNLNRTTAYQILDSLSRRGLVGHVIKNNIRFFKAASPVRLLETLKEKETELQQIVPLLLAQNSKSGTPYTATIYEGMEGLKTIMGDILRTKPSEWLDLTSGTTVDVLPKFFMNHWEKQRIKLKIRAKFLVNHTAMGKKRGKQLQKLALSDVRYLPVGFVSPVHVYVFGQKVGLSLWVKDFPFAILIESPEIAGRFTEFFGWLWKKGSKE